MVTICKTAIIVDNYDERRDIQPNLNNVNRKVQQFSVQEKQKAERYFSSILHGPAVIKFLEHLNTKADETCSNTWTIQCKDTVYETLSLLHSGLFDQESMPYFRNIAKSGLLETAARDAKLAFQQYEGNKVIILIIVKYKYII